MYLMKNDDHRVFPPSRPGDMPAAAGCPYIHGRGRVLAFPAHRTWATRNHKAGCWSGKQGGLAGEVQPGKKGELVLTSLTKEAMPLIRYCTGDITSIREDECQCGRT